MFDTVCFVPVEVSDLDEAEVDALPDGLAVADLKDQLGSWAMRDVQRSIEKLEAGFDAEQASELAMHEASVAGILAADQLQAFGEIEDASADQVLAAAHAAQREMNLAEARQLVLASQWAGLHGVDQLAGGAGAGCERLATAGGEATPLVGEFCPAELGAAFGITADAAADLIADALDLRFRLPLLWRRVRTGEVKPWICRKIAVKTRKLSQQAAGRVDRKVADKVDTLTGARLWRKVNSEIKKADRVQAKADAEQARTRQGVWIRGEGDDGYASLTARAPEVDLKALDVSLDQVARALSVLGDTDDHDVRRAKALTLMANPQAVLDLVAEANELIAALQREGTLAGPHEGTSPRRRVDLGKAVVYVHLTDTTLDAGDEAGADVVRVEGIGPVLKDQVCEWLGHRQVTVRPVIDIPGIRPVDCYEVPAVMAEALQLRTPASAFTYSANLSRAGDNDHTRPFVPLNKGGPPGQTGVDKLARLPRREHRIKTFAGWTMRQPRSGCFLWRTPHGYFYLVDEHGTHSLGRLQ